MGERFTLSTKGARMLTGFEAMILHQYSDVAGIPTVCVGHVVRPEDRVWIADGVTRDECLTVLQRDVARFEDAIGRVVHVPLSQPMIDALVSLEFNIGEEGFATSTVVRRLNARDYTGAADAFTMWRFAQVRQRDGTYQRQPVLLGRRESEAVLFRSGILQVVLGAQPGAVPSLESLLAKAQAVQFNPQDWLDQGHGSPTPENDNELTPDGRLVALPPDREDQAA